MIVFKYTMSDVFKVKKTRDANKNKSKDHNGTLDSLHQSHVESLRIRASSSHTDELEIQIASLIREIATIP